ncbi:hypothetical protein [Pseudophaeobacter sp.]|uniref:hypothetical protein n=1 Tax=Pseudophaeobacter sp. TaxID=1971739 RepID=UPI0032971B30
MRWNNASAYFEEEGSHRDIFVSNTTLSDWDRLISLSHALGQVTYLCDSEKAPFPSKTNSLFDHSKHTHCMKTNLGGPVIYASFFVVDEIELSLDPSEINSQEDLDPVLEFCASLGRNIQRDVAITEESSPKEIILYFANKDQAWHLPGPLRDLEPS